MELAAYLEKEGLTQAEFAERVRAHPITVNRWAMKKAFPRPEQRAAISEATGGLVTAADLLPAESAAHAEERA